MRRISGSKLLTAKTFYGKNILRRIKGTFPCNFRCTCKLIKVKFLGSFRSFIPFIRPYVVEYACFDVKDD